MAMRGRAVKLAPPPRRSGPGARRREGAPDEHGTRGGAVLPRAVAATVRRPRARRRAAEALTRAVDVVAALALLLLTAPVLLAGMGWVAVASGRPLFFGHLRVGKGGRRFRCWKLRTMHVDAERVLERRPDLLRLHRENGFKLPASRDPRIITGGRLLRKSQIDELPQIFNLLLGDMSLVGPRPVVEEELHLYGEEWPLLLSTRPGLFGAWTSRGRSRPPYPERARIELEWVRERGLLRDVVILVRSVGVVLRGQEEG